MGRLVSFPRRRKHFFDTGLIGNIPDDLVSRSGPALFLHLHADGLKIETHLLQDIHRHALAEFDESQKQMLSADVVVVKPVGFLASKRQNLLSPGCEIIHCSMAW